MLHRPTGYMHLYSVTGYLGCKFIRDKFLHFGHCDLEEVMLDSEPLLY